MGMTGACSRGRYGHGEAGSRPSHGIAPIPAGFPAAGTAPPQAPRALAERSMIATMCGGSPERVRPVRICNLLPAAPRAAPPGSATPPGPAP